MTLLGNIIWFIFGGFIEAVLWVFFGIIWSITIIGIPVGKQCFKMAKMQIAPFGKEVVEKKRSSLGMIANIIWIIFFGWELALVNLISALIFAVTIIGIPFAKQSLKLAYLSLMPFGKDIVKSEKR
ncbi:YccF domain-containing protein [Halanaerobium sp. Z-7514]|uniref:YccF domain-containing protein n=1 Tax=Halanaerobium polyolivorans TaxID=2886943 RepID=A0AAW4WUL7_9FIRM|nr:YccF domain-containing protein [Halanaerobium polyolivorans]MCC3144790.1 YccF domain-containing protein [Halanaerobium polyolivorans]RQD78798.1 MAG: YccF domain-containing protein [Halanaerobium sp. MSAO_Bac5]